MRVKPSFKGRKDRMAETCNRPKEVIQEYPVVTVYRICDSISDRIEFCFAETG